MAVLKAFRAWRPNPNSVEKTICVPYDVISTAEAREIAKRNSQKFINVIRPEVDLPSSVSIFDEEVYQQGKKNLERILSSDEYLQEQESALYLYRLVMNGEEQTGIFGCVSVEDYDNDVILKHELTRPDKEDDRTKHIYTQKAHAEPVMITFESNNSINEIISNTKNTTKALYDLTTEDGIQHTLWKVENPSELSLLFSNIPSLYIADGHHRCASASRTTQMMKEENQNHTGEEEYNFFPAVLFPMNEMQILPYNRIVFSIPDDFLSTLKSHFNLKENVNPLPDKKGDVSFYINETWYGLSLPESKNADVASSLDVARFQELILEPLLGIENQRTDSNIYFVGGIKGTKELERIVDTGEAELSVSFYPTSIKELMDVSDAGQLMPPKSTWFEPKLRSGLLIHTF